MITPVQWSVDLSDAFDAREAITAALHSGKNLIREKQSLRRCCDKLHALCCLFEDGDMCEEHEDTYLILFDALSAFTLALRWPAVNPRGLAQARDILDRLQRVGPIERDT